MFTAKVYKVMVGSLSGAMEEVHVAKETIQKWNQQNAEHTGKVFMSIDWNSNSEAMQSADIVVAVIDNWVDNPRFVEDCVEASKQVMLLFNSLQDPANTISSEHLGVMELLNRMQEHCFCSAFNGTTDVVNVLKERLDSFE